MTAWVALLRAVNVGGRKVPMDELRELLAGLGLGDVRTYIQSGNALFTSAEKRESLAGRIEAAVADAFGLRSAVMLRTSAELAGVAARHPFGADTSRSHVAFLAAKPPAKHVRALAELELGSDRVAVRGSEAYLHYPNGVHGARLGGALIERTLGVAATVRNWRTVASLAELAS